MAERGFPYSLAEAKIVAERHKMDPYHRELMLWLIKQVEEAKESR